jgi:hypothetical protein
MTNPVRHKTYRAADGRLVIVFDPWTDEPMPAPTVDNSRAEALAQMLRTSGKRP